MIAALISVIAVSQAQMVDPVVANFISNFSLAATEVELKPDAHGVYHQRDHLATTLMTMRGVNFATLEKAFTLLDKNESKQRLVVADLLLLLLYKVPDSTSGPAMVNLRDAIVPLPGEKPDSAKWPWQKESQDTWKLAPFEIPKGHLDMSLMDRLSAFKSYTMQY